MHFFNKILNKIRRSVIDIKHKYSKPEQIIKAESEPLILLKEKIKSIDESILVGTSSWENNRKVLCNLILNYDINNFLNWGVIQKTMFFEAPEVEYKKVATNEKLINSIKESKIGNPKPYFLNKETSGNLIHHAYSLSYFLDVSTLDSINRVIELGGGYGSMCRLFRNMQYKGEYIIFDLPEFCALQEFYIGSINKDYLNNTVFTSDVDYFKNIKQGKGILLIATWSLSEMPLHLRDLLLKYINFDYCLIAFQSNFEDIDNIKYFNNFKNIYKNINFKLIPIKHLPENFYIIGTRGK